MHFCEYNIKEMQTKSYKIAPIFSKFWNYPQFVNDVNAHAFSAWICPMRKFPLLSNYTRSPKPAAHLLTTTQIPNDIPNAIWCHLSNSIAHKYTHANACAPREIMWVRKPTTTSYGSEVVRCVQLVDAGTCLCPSVFCKYFESNIMSALVWLSEVDGCVHVRVCVCKYLENHLMSALEWMGMEDDNRTLYEHQKWSHYENPIATEANRIMFLETFCS